MEIIFELPDFGNLILEHIFYMYEEPILFICKDEIGNRYLCSCCQLSEKWVVAQVEETELIQLIEDKITIREIFESRMGTKFLIIWNGESYKLDTEVPSELLPKKGATLELGYK